MRHWIYQLLLWLSFPLWLYYSYRRCRQSSGRQGQCWRELWGLIHPEMPSGGIWIHAVSLGEAQVATHLMRHLRECYPSLPMVFTAGNDSALSVVNKAQILLVKTSYLPLDYQWIRLRFIQKLRPSLLVLIETELWPNLLLTAHQQQLPVVIVQARVSRRSKTHYPRYAQPLLSHLLAPVKLLAAQTEADRQFFVEMGIQPESSACFGNMKYDLPIAQEVLEHQGQRLLPKLHHRWVWCAGSTHPDEEIPILAAHLQLRKTIPEAILILAPRHLSHLEVIEGRLTQQGIVWMTWSSFLTATQVETSVQVILVDQLGVLISAYHISQACFVGGSLVPWGGHNMLEPAALKKPIVTGQHNHNFAEIADALSQHQALSNITEEQSLANLLIDWAQHPDIAQARGEAAYDVFLSQQGGTERLLSALSPWIASKWQGNPI